MTWKDLQHEPTQDLIEYIKCKGHADYSALADVAFIAFTFRFQREVVDKCRKIGRRWGYDNETCDSLAEEVFERFLRYPFGFKSGSCGTLDIDTCVKLYLFRVAQRRFIDHYHETNPDEASPYDGSEEVVVEFPDLDQMEISDELAENLKAMQDRIDKALSTLTPKHRVIYLTYKTYEQEGFKLPRELLKKLRQELELSQNSIRVYKKEAFDTAKKHTKN